MHSGLLKKFSSWAVVVAAGLILTAGIMSAADMHADCKFHGDCPLCQLKLNTSAPDIHSEDYTTATFPLFSITICADETIIPKNINFIANPSHAPPQS